MRLTQNLNLFNCEHLCLLTLRVFKIARIQSTFSFMLVGAMESAKTTQITDEVICLMDLQVEVLKGPLVEMTVSQIHDCEGSRHRIGQLCSDLGKET